MASETAVDPTAFTYYTTNLVQCDGQKYPTGSEFTHSDPAIIAELRKAGAIVLREEKDRPEAIAARVAEIEAENAALRLELEQLRRGGATVESAVAGKANTPAAAAAEPADESAIKASKKASQPASGASGGAGE